MVNASPNSLHSNSDGSSVNSSDGSNVNRTRSESLYYQSDPHDIFYYTPQDCPECEQRTQRLSKEILSNTDNRQEESELHPLPPIDRQPIPTSQSEHSPTQMKREIPDKPLPPIPTSANRTHSTQRVEKSGSTQPARSDPLGRRYSFTYVPSSTELFEKEVLEKVKDKRKLSKKQKFIKGLCVTGAIGGVVLVGAGFLAAAVVPAVLAVLCPPASVVVIGGLVLTASIMSMTGGGVALIGYSKEHLSLSSLKQIFKRSDDLGKLEDYIKRDPEFVSFLEKNYGNQVNVEFAQDYIDLYEMGHNEEIQSRSAIEKIERKQELLMEEEVPDGQTPESQLRTRIEKLTETNEQLEKEKHDKEQSIAKVQKEIDEMTKQFDRGEEVDGKEYKELKEERDKLKKDIKAATEHIKKNEQKLRDLKEIQEDLDQNIDYDAMIDEIRATMPKEDPDPEVKKELDDLKSEYDNLKERLEKVTETSTRTPSKDRVSKSARIEAQRAFAKKGREERAERREAKREAELAAAEKAIEDSFPKVYQQKLTEWKAREINPNHDTLNLAIDLNNKKNPFFLVPTGIPEVDETQDRLKKLDPAELDDPILILGSKDLPANQGNLSPFSLENDILSNSFEKPLVLPKYGARFTTPCRSVTHYMVTRRIEQMAGRQEFMISTDIKDKSPQYALKEFRSKFAQTIPDYGLKSQYLPFLSSPQKESPLLMLPRPQGNNPAEHMQRFKLEQDLREALFAKFVNPDGTPSEEGQALMDTGKRYLIAGGDDPIMGVVFNKEFTEMSGENLLGNMLMELRSFLNGEPPPPKPARRVPPTGQTPPLGGNQPPPTPMGTPTGQTSKGKGKEEKEKEKIPD